MDFNTIINKTNKNDLTIYTPLFNSKNVVVDKKDNKTWLIPKHNKPVVLNGTAYEILQLCDGKNNMYDINKHLEIKYKIDRKTIQEDIIRTLYSLWNSGVIIWPKKNNFFQPLFQDFIISKEVLFKNVQGAEIGNTITRTIGKSVLSDKYDSESMYTPININVRQNMLKEYYFGLYKNDVLNCFVGLEPIYAVRPIIANYKFHLEYLYLDEQLDLKDFDEFLIWSINWLKEYVGVYIKSTQAVISIQFLDDNKNKQGYIQNLGFELEGRLIKEYKNLDMIVYEKTISLT